MSVYKTYYIYIILVAMLFCFPIMGQGYSSLTLDKALELGRNANYKLRILEYQKQASKWKVAQAYSLLLPKIDLTAQTQHTDYKVKGRDPLAEINIAGSPIVVAPKEPSKYSSQVDIAVNQTLFSGGANLATIQYAQSHYKRESIRYKQEQFIQNNIITQLYWQAYSASLLHQYYAAKKDVLEKQYSLLKRKHQSGLIAEYTLKEYRVNLSIHSEKVILQQENKRYMFDQLSMFLGLEVLDSLGSSPRSLRDLSNVFEGYITSNAQTEDFTQKIAYQDYMMSLYNKHVLRGTFFPEFILTAGINYFDQDEQFYESKDSLKKGSTYVQVAATYPIFSGFKKIAKYKEAQSLQGMRKEQMRMAKRSYLIKINQLQKKSRLVFSKLQDEHKTSEFRESLYRDESFRYDEGLSTELDVLNTEINYIDSVLSYQLAGIEMEKVLSELKMVTCYIYERKA